MLNTWTGTGRITADPEIRGVEGKAYCTFYLAIDRDYKTQEGTKPTDFIPCKVWGSAADFLNTYVNKGDALSVKGRLQIDMYESSSGDTKYFTYVNVENVYIVSSAEKKETREAKEAKAAPKKTNTRRSRNDW